jgi:hypothetical protein
MEPAEGLARVSPVTGHTADLGAFYERTCASLVGLLAAIGGSLSDAEEIAPLLPTLNDAMPGRPPNHL